MLLVPSVPDPFASLRRWSPPLARITMISVVLLAVALVGLALDHRQITNAPAWLKPVKFALSIPLFTGTLAYMVRDLPRTRSLRNATTLIAWMLVVELVLIMAQAARGRASHFNVSTPLDAAIFSTMGLGIATVWVMSMLLWWLHVRTPAVDQAMARAFRVGLALHVLGAGIGWTMTQPRAEQLEVIARGARPALVGSHTIGAADGGPGLSLTGWSTEHGDLRIAHFVGMHALQWLPLLVLAMRRVRARRDDRTEQAAILVASAAYAAVFVAVFVQAMQGHPLIPFATT